MAVTIDQLQLEIKSSSTSAAANLDALSASLTRLRTAVKGGVGLTTATKQFQAFATAIKGVEVPTEKVGALVAALKPLETIGRSRLGTAINQLKKIPEVVERLDNQKIAEFAEKIQQVTAAILPLSTEMEKVALGFSRLPANIQKAINANAKLTNSNTKTAKSYGVLGTGIRSGVAKIGVLYLALRRVASAIGGWIKESNDYVENLHLFTVAMGKYAQSAKEYAEQAGEALGIDPSEFMRYQGVFMNMARGYGIAAEQAAIMSKNLTQLGYDLASLYNVSFDVAMEKLESALSGQPRPMREWGFDLSETTLKAKALQLGIEKNVESMSQGEKALIRYVQLLDTARRIGALGDMARTLEAPANQLRVLEAQAIQAARALGNIFIPALNAILPVAIAVINVIRDLAASFAALFGYSLPEIDYSGVEGMSGALDDVGKSAGGAAKQLERYNLAIDELNVISESKGGGGAGSNASTVLEQLSGNLPVYTFLDEVKRRVDNLKESVKGLLEVVGLVGLALAGWMLADKLSKLSGIAGLLKQIAGTVLIATIEFVLAGIYYGNMLTAETFTDALVNFLKSMFVIGAGSGILYAIWGPGGIALGMAIGVAAIITALTTEIKKGNIGLNDPRTGFTAVVAGALSGIAGVALVKALGVAVSGPVAFTVGVGVGVVATIVSALLANQARRNLEEIARRFGDIALSSEQIAMAAKAIVDSGFSKEIGAVADSAQKSKELYAELKKVADLVEADAFRVNLGINTDPETLVQNLSDFVGKANAFMDQNVITVKLAFGTLGMEGDTTGMGGAQTEIEALGRELKQKLSEAFVDGEWIPDKYQEALKIYDEMQEVIALVSEAQFQAEIGITVRNWKVSDLNQEAFVELQTKIAELTQSKLDSIEQIEVAARAEAWVQFQRGEIDETSYNQMIAEIESRALVLKMEGIAEITLINAEAVRDRFGTELELALTDVDYADISQKAIQSFNTHFMMQGKTWADAAPEEIVRYLTDGMTQALKGMYPEEVRAAAEEYYKALEPTEQQATELVSEAMQYGKKLPESLAKGLNDIQALGAVAGNIEAIQYMIGANFTTDPEWIKLLSTVEGAGKEVPASMALGIWANIDKLEQAIQGGLIQMTPTLKKNLEEMGIELPELLPSGLQEGVSNVQDGLTQAGVSSAEYFAEGANTKMIQGAAEAAEAFKNEVQNGINSSAEALRNSGTSAGGTVSGGFLERIKQAAREAARLLADVNVDPLKPGYNSSGRTPETKASGGFVSAGQMFIAREAGPELVGTIGGKTAVANNDQIVEGIAEGVYEAVITAINNSGGSGNVQLEVYLDGKQIESSVRTTQQRRGVALATGGIYNYGG